MDQLRDADRPGLPVDQHLLPSRDRLHRQVECRAIFGKDLEVLGVAGLLQSSAHGRIDQSVRHLGGAKRDLDGRDAQGAHPDPLAGRAPRAPASAHRARHEARKRLHAWSMVESSTSAAATAPASASGSAAAMVTPVPMARS